MDGAQALRTLADFRDVHRGESIVVCGCGTSLDLLRAPHRHLTIGVNDVGRRFAPDYLVVVNDRRQFDPERYQYVQRSSARAIFSQIELDGVPAARLVRFGLGQRGGTDRGSGDVLHYTSNSPYVAVQLARLMGARRIGLIGVDFTDDHFFAPTGTHKLAAHLDAIDREYGALAAALRAEGIELVNLSPTSRLISLPGAGIDSMLRIGCTPSEPSSALRVVSYATTPVAGVPSILARCIGHATPHLARCAWATDDYGNGVRFAGDIEWNAHPDAAIGAIEQADLVIVHNGKVDPRHATLIASKPTITMAHNYGWNVDFGLVTGGWPGVVVGQYQATLPEFAGWDVVPNPVPLWEADHCPGSKTDAGMVVVAYTPSGRHERYPAGHRLYWHAKGFDTTMRALERLGGEHRIEALTTAREQVTHAQSLAMKRRAHVVIDECVTGSYHRNSLEGLAAGCVVVNGMGLAPGVRETFATCAGVDYPDDLFEPATLETLESRLDEVISRGVRRLTEQGLANRAWMERHWSFAHQWQRHWARSVDRALNGRRRATASAPVSAKPARATPVEGASIVIPFGGAERLPLLESMLEGVGRAAAVAQAIVVEMGVRPLALAAAERHRADYVFIACAGPFERARALNAGSRLARAPEILWCDGDVLFGRDFVANAIAEFRARGLDFMLPYAHIAYLGEADSDAVRSVARDPAACRPIRTMRSLTDVSGGLGLVSAALIERHGGMIEGFRGWGGEDNAWIHKASVLGRVGATHDPAQVVWHLYHADNSAAGHKPWETNPDYGANVQLLDRVKRTRSTAELEQQFPRRAEPPWPADRTIELAFIEGSAGRTLAERWADQLRRGYGIAVARVALPSVGAMPTASADCRVLVVDDATMLEAALAGAYGEAIVVIGSDTVRCDDAVGRSEMPCIVAATPEQIHALRRNGQPVWHAGWARDGNPIPLIAQPISIVLGDRTRRETVVDVREQPPAIDAITGQPEGNEVPLTVWSYWEGPCPAWIERCLRTFAHATTRQILDRPGFDALWRNDRDVDIDRLSVVHRSDFIRAYLLAHHGGLWIDADCVLMREPAEVFALLEDTDFVAHRDRQGWFPNGFMAARRGSVIARALYQRVCAEVRSRRPLGWTSLGGHPLTAILRATSVCWREIDCARVQPVCWSRPEAFFVRADDAAHESAFDRRALCYMMSNTEVRKYQAVRPDADLMQADSFFSFLLRRALPPAAPAVAEPPSVLGVTPFAIECLEAVDPKTALQLGTTTDWWSAMLRQHWQDRERSRTLAERSSRTDAGTPAPTTPELRAIPLDERCASCAGADDACPIDDPLPQPGHGGRWDLVVIDGMTPSGCAGLLRRSIESSHYVLVPGGVAAARRASLNDAGIRVVAESGSAGRGGHEGRNGGTAVLLSRDDRLRLGSARRMLAVFEQRYSDARSMPHETVSGPGSSLEQTVELRRRLPALLRQVAARSLLDAGCGDLHWIARIDLALEQFIGVDIVPALVDDLRRRFGGDVRRFIAADICTDPLPSADVILCRDCLGHLASPDVQRALRNFRRSGASYLLATTFPRTARNEEIETGGWRPLNLERVPFSLPPPVTMMVEHCTEAQGRYADKSLGLWRLADPGWSA